MTFLNNLTLGITSQKAEVLWTSTSEGCSGPKSWNLFEAASFLGLDKHHFSPQMPHKGGNDRFSATSLLTDC